MAEMKLPERLNQFARPPKLTRLRIVLALAVAVSADGLQLLLNGVGWIGPDQVIDVIAMVLTWWLIGFHWLLLPSFMLELVPVADDLPTWTACVTAVVVLRKRQQRSPPPLPPEKPPIEI
jgi:hypothetical protein